MMVVAPTKRKYNFRGLFITVGHECRDLFSRKNGSPEGAGGGLIPKMRCGAYGAREDVHHERG